MKCNGTHLPSVIAILCAVLCFLPSTSLKGQVTILTEDFENNCTSGCLAETYSSWSVTSTGTEGSCPNTFFISCAENGNAAGSCGSGCGSDESLHIANQSCSPWSPVFCPAGDCGAAYDADATCDAFSCTFGLCFCTGVSAVSNRRAEFPVDLTGFGNLNISFNYIEEGSGALDDASFQYFDGSVWTTVVLPKTANATCGGQGFWTSFTVALPATLYNNANARIGFLWVNNGDGAGSDPSFAVDDILLTGDPILENTSTNLRAIAEPGGIQLSWDLSNLRLSSDAPILLHSFEQDVFAPLVQGTAQQFFHATPRAGLHRYRLQWKGENSEWVYGKVKTMKFEGTSLWLGTPYPVPVRDRLSIPIECGRSMDMEINLFDLQGKYMMGKSLELKPGQRSIDLQLEDIPSGVYLLKMDHFRGRSLRRILVE